MRDWRSVPSWDIRDFTGPGMCTRALDGGACTELYVGLKAQDTISWCPRGGLEMPAGLCDAALMQGILWQTALGDISATFMVITGLLWEEAVTSRYEHAPCTESHRRKSRNRDEGLNDRKRNNRLRGPTLATLLHRHVLTQNNFSQKSTLRDLLSFTIWGFSTVTLAFNTIRL